MFKVLIAGCGNMGSLHALAYAQIPQCKIVALVAPHKERRNHLAQKLQDLNIQVTQYSDFFTALENEQPDIVCIASYTNTHARYAIAAMEAGAHVFVEKPLATNLDEAKLVLATAAATGKKLVIGLILRHHPSWQKFIEASRQLGKPLVMRMNLNQQSYGVRWQTHCNLMQALSPLVECGIHYVDVMCQMTQASPVTVYALGRKLTNQPINSYNYGMLQITFSDGSIGWYEAGWGPMMSNNAHFIKDVIGPLGSASIIPKTTTSVDSANIDGHVEAENILLHYGQVDDQFNLLHEDQLLQLNTEPSHLELCLREQQYLLDSIIQDKDLTEHLNSAQSSLAIVLAADESVRTGKVINI